MELRQRKRIKNQLPKFNNGSYSMYQSMYGDMPKWNTYGSNIDLKGKYNNNLNNYYKDTANDVNNMVGDNTPQGYNQKDPSWDTKTSKNIDSNGGMDMVGSIGAMANQDIATIYDMQMNQPSSQELMAKYGQSNTSAFGVNYQQQNDIDAQKELKDYESKGLSSTLNMTLHGAKAGGPGWGAAIGAAAGLTTGLANYFVGRNKLKRTLERARRNAMNKRELQFASAATQGLQNKYYLDNGDSSTGVLYT